MVPADDDGPGPPRHIEHAERVGAARDEVADEDEAVARGEPHAIEHLLELAPAAVHVADDDGASHPIKEG